MEVKSLNAIQSYASAKPATEPAQGGGGINLGRVVSDFASVLSNAEETAQASMVGNADPHALVQALAQTELAVETAVTVRNKVVEAYQ